MKKLILLFLSFSFTAQAQLQLINGGTPTELLPAGGGTYRLGIPLTANTTLKTLDNKSYIISGNITGAFDLTAEIFAGSKLTLTGTVTYSGSTGVTGGELILTNTSGFVSPGLHVSAGATLTFDASAYGSISSRAAPYLVFGSNFTSNIMVTGAGQVNFKGQDYCNYGVYSSTNKSMVFNMESGGQLNIVTGYWTVGAAGVAAFAGNLGSLNIATTAEAADNSGLITVGTTVEFDKVTGTGRIELHYAVANDLTIKIGAGNGTCDWGGYFPDNYGRKTNIEKVGTGAIRLKRELSYSTLTITDGTILTGGDFSSIVNNGTLILDRSKASSNFDAFSLPAISGIGNFVKKGSARVVLPGDNNGIISYTGTTTVESGELDLVCQEIKSSGITVQSGGTLTIAGHINNEVITSAGSLSLTANSAMRFVFPENYKYPKLAVPGISAPDGFLVKFTGRVPTSLSGDITLIECIGTLPTIPPTVVENSVNYGSNNKCIRLKWVQGTGLVATIAAGPIINPISVPNLCIGGMQSFTTSSGGTPVTPAWRSSNPEILSISTDGKAKGLLFGKSAITYSNTAGCVVSSVVEVRGHVIRPKYNKYYNAAFCLGNTVTLGAYNAPTYGTYSNANPAWTSDRENVATVVHAGRTADDFGHPESYVTLRAIGTAIIKFKDGDGCIAEFPINLKNFPTVEPSGRFICVGSTIIFTGSGTAAATNPWTSDDINIVTVTSDGKATGVAVGSVYITFTDSNGCKAKTSLSVRGAPPVIPIANAGEDKEICAGNSTTIGMPAQTGFTYSWGHSGTGLSSFSVPDPVASPKTTTTYTLVVSSVSRPGCWSSDRVEVRVNPLPTITSIYGPSSYISPGGTIELTASTDGTANPWSTSDDTKVTVAAGTDPKKATASGVAIGNATITYTDVKGCRGTHPVSVSNKTNQTITFDPIADKTIGDANFTVSAKVVSSLPVTFSTTSDKVSVSGNSVTILKVGKANIQADQGGNETYNPAPRVSSNMFCINPPTPTTTYAHDNKTLTSSSANGNQWFRNGDAIPGATANTCTVASDGSYTVKVTIEECVSAPSESKVIVVTGDIPDGEFYIYPNPVRDQLVIELPSRENGLISLFSITGQNLYSTSIAGKATLSMKDFPVGIYILKIQTAGKMTVRKVVRN